MRFLRKKDKMDENRAAFVSKVNSLNHSVIVSIPSVMYSRKNEERLSTRYALHDYVSIWLSYNFD